MEPISTKDAISLSQEIPADRWRLSVDRNLIPNAFEFVAVASARAKQLLQGCLPKVEPSAKPARTAQREVLSGLVYRAEPTSPQSEVSESSP